MQGGGSGRRLEWCLPHLTLRLRHVRQPVRTVSVENFAADEVAKVAAQPRTYDVALVFSTKYDPPPGGLDLSAGQRSTRGERWLLKASEHDTGPASTQVEAFVAPSTSSSVHWLEVASSLSHPGSFPAKAIFRRRSRAETM